MATPCANCVYRGTKYCAIFCGRVFRKLLSVNVPTLVMTLAVTIFSSDSWGACTQGTYNVSVDNLGVFCKYTGSSNAYPKSCTHYSGNPCPERIGNYLSPTGGLANQGTQGGCPGISNSYMFRCTSNLCVYTISCTTQAEADSVYCALNPTAEGCVVETDTTLFACTDNISGNGGLYRLACKAENGVVTYCNGKTNVDIATDGTLVRPLQGTCAQNGFNTGIIGGASSDSTSTPPSANADCFAIVGSTCHMKDKASGNTFRCECDGSCNVALRNLMAGNADCTNPYEQPEQTDSLDFPLSSPSSSGSGEGSSPSSSPSGEGNSSDFEYDYTEILEAIQANTQQTATEIGRSNEFLNGIQNNTETANSLLQAIANKDWTPNINVSAPHVNVQGDTNIINVEVQGDTARAPSEILALLRQGGNTDPADTAGLGAQLAGYVSGIDSLVGEGVPDMSDSLGSAVASMRATLQEIKDTMDNSAISDSLTRWNALITNNGVITGEGSNNCPSILTQQITLDFPIVGRVQGGTLGKYLCEPVEPFGVTLWTFVRLILRAIVAITCMFWLYRAVLGLDGRDDED